MSYIPFPKVVYKNVEGAIEARTVKDEKELKKFESEGFGELAQAKGEKKTPKKKKTKE